MIPTIMYKSAIIQFFYLSFFKEISGRIEINFKYLNFPMNFMNQLVIQYKESS